MRKPCGVVGIAACVVTCAVGAKAQAPLPKPVAKWDVFVVPQGATTGTLTYAVAASGRTLVPVPGSGWFCGTGAPRTGVDAAGRYEEAILLCATADGHSVNVRALCRPDHNELARMVIGAPPGGQDYTLGLGCTPFSAPAAKPKPLGPIEKDL